MIGFCFYNATFKKKKGLQKGQKSEVDGRRGERTE